MVEEAEPRSHTWTLITPGTRIGGTSYELHQLPQEVESQCVHLTRALGLAFGAIDLILTPQGEYVFLEINPNGQWAWLQQVIPSLPLREALADLLIGPRND
jgi:glutathione synthase/RimK-type ligase-like ATP-grasp enzyme